MNNITSRAYTKKKLIDRNCREKNDLYSMLDQYKKIEEKMIFEGNYKKLKAKQFKLPNGTEHTFEIIQGNRSCIIFALTSDNKIITVKQFRAGPEQVFYELPAGLIDPGEEPVKAAQRELMEETGYSGELEFVSQAFQSAYSEAFEYVFIAKNCRKIAEPRFDVSEYAETVLFDLSELRAIIRTREFLHAHGAYLALDYLHLLGS